MDLRVGVKPLLSSVWRGGILGRLSREEDEEEENFVGKDMVIFIDG